MVKLKRETFKPNYLLDDIRQAAKQKNGLRYAGRKVDIDIKNLEYTNDDVKRCIGMLTSRNFLKCLHYENAIYDVYKCDYQKNSESKIDSIYMKLRLLKLDGDEIQVGIELVDDTNIQVGIGSFHLS